MRIGDYSILHSAQPPCLIAILAKVLMIEGAGDTSHIRAPPAITITKLEPTVRAFVRPDQREVQPRLGHCDNFRALSPSQSG